MKKYIIYLILIIVPINVMALDINSPNYIMYNLTDDQVIMEQGSEEQIYVASLTKIATAIVAIENIDNLEESFPIPYEGLVGLIEANASVAGFQLGQTVTYKDLLYGLMLPSGADAAQTLAYQISGSDAEFVKLMNDLANKLNLKSTNFTNTTGLYDENHYSSIQDIGVLLKYALENETFETIFNSEKYLISDKSITLETSYVTVMKSFNLTNNYILGAKTGFIDEAGFCLASIASFDDKDFMLITAGADYITRTPYHIMDALSIYEYVDNNYDYVTLFKKGDILAYVPTINSTRNQYNVIAEYDYKLYADVNNNIKNYDFVYNGIDKLSPDAEENSIGDINIMYNDILIDTIEVNYDGTLEYSMSGLVNIYWQYILGAGVFTTFILILLLKRKKRR